MIPFKTLPRILIPIPRDYFDYMPPIMHYGWSIDDEMVRYLKNFAERRGLSKKIAKQGPDGKIEQEAGDEIEPETGDEKVEQEADDDKKGKRPVYGVNDIVMPNEALKRIVRGTPKSATARHVQINLGAMERFRVIVSLFTNYTLPYGPTSEFIKALGKVLRVKGEPMWYLDAEYWCWKEGVPERMVEDPRLYFPAVEE